MSAWIPVQGRVARGAGFGVRQPYCRSSRAYDLARGVAVHLLVMVIPGGRVVRNGWNEWLEQDEVR
ncbi:MAG: hypothetical protein ACUVSL_14335 [Chloroflexus sp.]|uniref:hypothetical protein n=1 Tax=Chloroflexus sp. TaxID=1904827 RepID=UPI004049870D